MDAGRPDRRGHPRLGPRQEPQAVGRRRPQGPSGTRTSSPRTRTATSATGTPVGTSSARPASTSASRCVAPAHRTSTATCRSGEMPHVVDPAVGLHRELEHQARARAGSTATCPARTPGPAGPANRVVRSPDGCSRPATTSPRHRWRGSTSGSARMTTATSATGRCCAICATRQAPAEPSIAALLRLMLRWDGRAYAPGPRAGRHRDRRRLQRVTDGPAATVFVAFTRHDQSSARSIALPSSVRARLDTLSTESHQYDVTPLDNDALVAADPGLRRRWRCSAPRTVPAVEQTALAAAVAAMKHKYGARPASWRRHHGISHIDSLSGVVGPSDDRAVPGPRDVGAGGRLHDRHAAAVNRRGSVADEEGLEQRQQLDQPSHDRPPASRQAAAPTTRCARRAPTPASPGPASVSAMYAVRRSAGSVVRDSRPASSRLATSRVAVGALTPFVVGEVTDPERLVVLDRDQRRPLRRREPTGAVLAQLPGKPRNRDPQPSRRLAVRQPVSVKVMPSVLVWVRRRRVERSAAPCAGAGSSNGTGSSSRSPAPGRP